MNAPLTVRGLECKSAMDYFLDVLESAGASDVQRDRDQLAKGKFFAVVPGDASAEQVRGFHAGGLLHGEPGETTAVVREVPSTIPTIATIVVECARDFNDPVLWIHEPLLGEDELSARWLVPRRVGKELFLILEGEGVREAVRVAESIDYAMLSWHLLAFLIDGVRGADSISGLLEQAHLVLAGAYDGESALLWRRT